MKFKRIYDAPAEFIFQKIIDSCLYDVKQATGRTKAASQLTGFSYKKKISGQMATVKFDEVIVPRVYEFTTTTGARTYHTRWELSAVEAGQTEIFIKDTNGTSNIFQLFTDRMMEWMLTTMKRRQIDTMIKKMVEGYKK